MLFTNYKKITRKKRVFVKICYCDLYKSCYLGFALFLCLVIKRIVGLMSANATLQVSKLKKDLVILVQLLHDLV